VIFIGILNNKHTYKNIITFTCLNNKQLQQAVIALKQWEEYNSD